MGDRDAYHDPSPLPSNLSSPSITSWVPNDFSIAVAINKDRPAMSVVGMCMNAIYTMYDLCNMDENANIPRRLWSLSDYGVTVEIGATETRFAIWGLQRTADSDASDAGLRPLISQLLLGGRDKGGVIVRPISVSLRNILPNSEGDNASAIPVQFMNTTSSLDQSDDLGGEIDIHQTYNGVDLTPQYVFTECLTVMSFAAQFGPNAPAAAMNVDGGFTITADRDSTGRIFLRYRHVFKLMRVIANTHGRKQPICGDGRRVVET